MSHAGSNAPRTLSLTEELERLEQSITLTLQEIDSNFSKSHRIVTTKILPLVEQYGEHSKSVWEATKFWKQFFEASANVSLSGYEELAKDEETQVTETEESSTIHDVSETTDANSTYRTDEDATVTGSVFEGRTRRRVEDSLLSDDVEGDLSGSTPRPPRTKTLPDITIPVAKPQFADLTSPYEALKRELKNEAETPNDRRGGGNEDEDSDMEIMLQQHTTRLPRMSMTPRSGEEAPSYDGNQDTALQRRRRQHDDDDDYDDDEGGRSKNKDRLLHRVLDKNYRLLATPHKGIATGVSPLKWKVTARKDGTEKGKEKEKPAAWQDLSPMSSPEMAVPELRSAAFVSPLRAAYRKPLLAGAVAAPRTPGVSVHTPAAARGKTRDVYRPAAEASREKHVGEITWDSDDDDDDDALQGMSPPKTIQFALPPSKLLQTPAREASKRIVDDILLTAGAEFGESSEYSPTVVKMNHNILDETF